MQQVHYIQNFVKGLGIFAIIFLTHPCYSQNLFANSGLEDLNICTEYHEPCAPEAWFYIKPTANPLVNERIAPNAFSGKNILLVPIDNVLHPFGVRSYVYTMLTCPLISGEKYKLSFYLNTAERKFYNIDFYFSKVEPATYNFNTYDIKPSFSITNTQITAKVKTGWQAVEYEFTATGNEKFCMLGNMSDNMSYSINDKMNTTGEIFYFLDELKLMPQNECMTCAGYNENLKKMYAQNYRHTDFTFVDPEITRPVSPKFMIDTINIPSIYFETNSAKLKQSFKKVMDSLTIIFEGKKIVKMDITGYTDNKGTIEKNLILSSERAASVKEYVVKQLPALDSSIFVFGKGQQDPVAENNSEQGRAKNRRVKIILTMVLQKK
jgi:outer membrane protein OmpA-like peptidoglycan-associated protein